MTATKPKNRAAPRPGTARRIRDRRVWEPALLALCAAVAAALALSSPPWVPQQIWAMCAAPAYAVAALTAMSAPGRRARSTAIVAASGTVVLPFVLLVVLGKAQMEVGVIERAGELLLSTGSAYLEDPSRISEFNPYLPGMALFGIPSALFGDLPGGALLSDPRWWFAACFLTSVLAAARVADLGRRTRPALMLVAVCPAVALPLAIGGVDPPVVGLMCLGLAYAGRGDGGRAGLALGMAAALKWTAWPALPVVFALLAVQHRKALLRCGASASGVVALVCAPMLVTDPQACIEQVVLYPLGLADIPSSAASPLPGHLLATHVPYGTVITLTALAITAALMAASLLVRPPRSACAAAERIALGLTLAMLLAPATRIGYVIYPLVLFIWFRITITRPSGDTASTSPKTTPACRYRRLLTARRRRGPVSRCTHAQTGTCGHRRPERHKARGVDMGTANHR